MCRAPGGRVVVVSRSTSAADLEAPLVVEGGLHPPRTRPEWITRPRLLRLIEMATEQPVLLISAPAGYGKTTLVAQWADDRHSKDTAWVDLEPSHNDPASSEQLDPSSARFPDHVHLALISRTDPQLRLGRLRVQGKLAEIRAADLSFTLEETLPLGSRD